MKTFMRHEPNNRSEPLDIELIEVRCKQLGLSLEPYVVAWREFEEYQRIHAGNFGRWNNSKEIEKHLEYFVSETLLDISSETSLIDIGSWFSTYPGLIRKKYGCKAYAQDLSFKEGIHGWRIGSDAARLPLPDNSLSAMTLHCTFEHFENDTDIRFIREVDRVLIPGGRVVIVPLYLHQNFMIRTDPSVFESMRIKVDEGASIFRDIGYCNHFGRYYNPEAFYERIYQHMGNLCFKLLRIVNVHELDPRCYLRFIGLIEKKR